MKIEFHFLSSSIIYGGKRNCQVRLRRLKPITYAYLLDSFFRGYRVKNKIGAQSNILAKLKQKNLGSFYLFLRRKFCYFSTISSNQKGVTSRPCPICTKP